MKFFFEEIVLKNKLKKLEEVLTLNQKSRDVLYHISQVYKQLGDEKKARDYFLKAKAVDPDL
jgi:Tetratricopeptide repeat.